MLTSYTAGATLSTRRVLAALTSAFDLAVHAVNLGEHVFRTGLHLQVGRLAVRVALNAEFLLDGSEHLQHVGEFMLREELNLHIQLPPTVCRGAEAVLNDGYEGREKMASNDTMIVKSPEGNESNNDLPTLGQRRQCASWTVRNRRIA